MSPTDIRSSPLFHKLVKARLDTDHGNTWDDDLTKCHGTKADGKPCRRKLAEHGLKDAKHQWQRLLTLSEIDEKRATSLVRDIYCHYHCTRALEEWDGWWATKQREEDDVFQDDSHRRGRDGGRRGGERDCRRDERNGFQDGTDYDDVEPSNDDDDDDDDSYYSPDASPTSNSIFSVDNYRSGGTPFTIPDIPDSGSPASRIPETQAAVPETPTKQGRTNTETRLGATKKSVKLQELEQDEDNTGGAEIQKTASKITGGGKGTSPRRPPTPCYTDPHLGVVKYATVSITKWKLLKMIERPFIPKEDKTGLVYVLQHKGNRSYCKVGFTEEEDVKIRVKQQKCYDLEGTVWYTGVFKGAYRVESLVKEDLVRQQVRVVSCKKCGTGHVEWFRINRDTLQAKVMEWKGVVQSALYDESGRVREAAGCALAEAFDISPERVREVVSSGSRVPRHETLTGRVDEGKSLDAALSHAHGLPVIHDAVNYCDGPAKTDRLPPTEMRASLEVVVEARRRGGPTYVSKSTQTRSNHGDQLDSAGVAQRVGLSSRIQSGAKTAFQKVKQPREGPTNPKPTPNDNMPFVRRASMMGMKIQRRMSSFTLMGDRDGAGGHGGKVLDGWRRVKKETFR